MPKWPNAAPITRFVLVTVQVQKENVIRKLKPVRLKMQIALLNVLRINRNVGMILNSVLLIIQNVRRIAVIRVINASPGSINVKQIRILARLVVPI